MDTKKMNSSKSNGAKKAPVRNNKYPFIKAKIDQLTDYGEHSGLKAYASVIIGGKFAVHGFRVYESEKGLFVMMPSRKVGDNYVDVFHALTQKDRANLQDIVLKEYKNAIQQDENETQTNDAHTEENMVSEIEEGGQALSC